MTPSPRQLSSTTLCQITHCATVIYWLVFLGAPVLVYLLEGKVLHHVPVFIMLGVAAALMTLVASASWRVCKRDVAWEVASQAIRAHDAAGDQ